MAASLGTGFLKTDAHLATPDIQFHIQPWSADSPAEGPHKFSAFTASVLQLRPESAGHLALRYDGLLEVEAFIGEALDQLPTSRQAGFGALGRDGRRPAPHRGQDDPDNAGPPSHRISGTRMATVRFCDTR